MPFLWIVLVSRGKQTFKMLHKSQWNVKVYITLTILTFTSICKVTWRSKRFFLDWTLCPDKIKSMECYGVVRNSKWLFNWTLLFWRKRWQTHLPKTPLFYVNPWKDSSLSQILLHFWIHIPLGKWNARI